MGSDVISYQYITDWDSELELPYYYKQFQKEIVIGKAFLQKNLENFKQEAESLACIIGDEDLESLSYQNSIFKRNSRELLEESYKVSDRIRPIIAYYAVQQYAAFFIYTVFKYPITSVSAGHGLSIYWGEGKEANINSIEVELHNTGFFRRFADTFTILGYPSAYSLWLPIQQENWQDVFVENFLSSRIEPSKVGLLSLMNFGFKESERATEFQQKFPKQVYSDIADWFLTDFILLFVASDLARYRPQLWKQVLEGKSKNEAEFNRRMKTVYDVFSIRSDSYFQTFHHSIWSVFELLKRRE